MFNLLPRLLSPVYCDAPEPWQIGFQDSATLVHEEIANLHNEIFFYLILIFVGVGWVLGSIVVNYSHNKSPIVYKYANHGTLIELVWTITPAFILIAIAFPSFKLLYLMDEVVSPSMTIKVVGHQWYWSYEYSDFVNDDGESIEFDSYMIPESDLEDGQLRLLDVDNRVVVPVDTTIRFVVTGADVLHDFAVPSLGVKIDCCPGRLNQTSVHIKREGIFYGQCSELCGVYHGFMPIAVEAVSTERYLSWLDSQGLNILNLGVTGSGIIGLSDDIIPWVDTVGSKEARVVLQSIFDYYSPESPLGRFINNNCSHLLEQPTGNTGIKLSNIQKEGLLGNDSSILLSNSFTPSEFSNKAGVYCVTNLETNDQYLGSAINFRARWENHYQNMLGDKPSPLHKDLLDKGISNYLWTQVAECPSYLTEFIKSGESMEVKEVRALQIITQYECRLLEQSLITALEPKLNGSNIVNFSFNWNPNVEMTDIRGSRPIQGIDVLTGETLEFSSIRSAGKLLDMDQRSIKGILNYEGYTRFSRTHDKFYSFVDPSLPMLEGSPHYNAHLPMFDGIDYTAIPNVHVWAYDTDLNRVATFLNQGHAAKECDITTTSVRRGLNRVFVNCIYLGAPILLLFMTNRLTTVKTSIVLTDTQSDISFQFEGTQAVQKWLKMTVGGSLRNFYLDTGKVYKKRWLFSTLENYTGPTPITPPVSTEKYLSWLDSQG